MVSAFRCRSLSKTQAGYTVTELIVSTAIFSSISLGLLMGFTSLERNYVATSDFSLNHADEMRISDYMGMDLRRAIAVEPAENDMTILIPGYYGHTVTTHTLTLVCQGVVCYGERRSLCRVHG